jgi:hypothetical protein
MSVLQRTMRMFVMAALAVSSHIGYSQDGGYHPFSEPLEFDPDWQFFAPVQLQDMQDLTARQRANTGFYIAYDRMNAGMSRSDTEAASNKIDFTWGNRYDFGWMKSNESGWSFSVSQINGPNSSNTVTQQRLNEFVSDATGGNGVGGANIPTQAIVGTLPFIPRDARNNLDGERIYELFDSVNIANFSSFEANKTWRMEPYRYGGILEPMIGLRYAKLGDIAHNDTYTVLGLLNTATPPAIIAFEENLFQDRVVTDNHMLLGQLGFRYTKFINKWTLSNDMKFFGGHVYQNQQTSRINEATLYANPIGVGVRPVGIGDRTGSTFSGRRNEESTWGFDLRVEGSYKAFKHLDLRGGFGLLYFGSGIWRGATITENSNVSANQFRQNQDIVIPAFTFGIALNR